MTRRTRREYVRLALCSCSVLGSGCAALQSNESEPENASIESRTADWDTGEIHYDVVRPLPGEKYVHRVGSGDRFENKLIDISEPGATFNIEATGSDWVIRNVGVKGVWDRYEKTNGIKCAVDEGSTGRIENFYFADGALDNTYPGVTGIYVYRHHEGTLEIDRVNIQDMPDNAIYASTPGRPDDNDLDLPGGHGGVVEITNSYAADCQSSHFRIGTDGSFVQNCVAVGEGGHRGFWGRFQDTRVVDCDLSGHPRGDVAVGSNYWEGSHTATVEVENCRFGSTNTYWDGNEVRGESVGEPQSKQPDGVPTSAFQAAVGDPDG